MRSAGGGFGLWSGVLGLASLALGAHEVFAADTDSLAVRATTDNAALNALKAEQLRVSHGSNRHACDLAERRGG